MIINEFGRREFLHKVIGTGTTLFLLGNSVTLSGCNNRDNLMDKITRKSSKYKKVLVLGMDGLDFKLVSHLIQQGSLPNFNKLAGLGTFSPLSSSNSPQSPVAWASIATGHNPGYHGIFDFIRRRESDYIPELAILKMNPKNLFRKRESMFLPVMQGNAFWDYTSSLNIPSTILRWPVTFQPKPNQAKLFSGLGVPDLKGGLGTYSFYTTKSLTKTVEGLEKITPVVLKDHEISTQIHGPQVAKLREKKEALADLTIRLNPEFTKIEIIIAENRLEVSVGEWSKWIEVKFKVGFGKTISGMVKFFLNKIKPDFELYMTAIQINPKDPAFVISNPDHYIRELSEATGDFYTLGIPEDTKALTEGRIQEETFIQMCDEIIHEIEKLFWFEMNRFKEGLLSSVFFTTDRIQHIFWVTKDPSHPFYNAAYAKKYGKVIDLVYQKMDKILGQVLAGLDEHTALFVLSDHGFNSFRRAVHVNSWLVENGFMKLTQKMEKEDKEGGPLFQCVDWENTYAYSLGFGSIFLNKKGREKHGIITKENEGKVRSELTDKLKKFIDPKDGKQVVKAVYQNYELYSGDQMNNSPDQIIGFETGYRTSWQSGIGGTPAVILEDNLNKWTGDHIVDASIVPGILLTNFDINRKNPSVMDIAPSVLSCFGLTVPEMEGKSLL